MIVEEGDPDMDEREPRDDNTGSDASDRGSASEERADVAATRERAGPR